jgi:membrane-associated phospholipid phosphatase
MGDLVTSGPPSDLIVPASFAILFLALWGAADTSIPWLLRNVRALAGRHAAWLRGHGRFGPASGRRKANRSYLPLILTLSIGTVLIVAAADVFVDIAAALAVHDASVQRIDTAVYDWFLLHRTPFLNAMFTGITLGGGPLGMTAIVLVVSIVLTARRWFRGAAYLLITATGGVLLNQLLKIHFARQRPGPAGAILGSHGYSFPSGHAMGGTYVLFAIGYLAARAVPNWKSKSAVFAALVSFDLAISTSRLYLGLHWTSDVVAGLAVGFLWVTATTSGFELFREYHMLEAQERALAPIA